jgi:periplasmic divalent cation tolerance protein
MTDKVTVFCTCGSEEEGVRIARLLVEGRLAACASLIPGVRSIYHWQGAVEDSAEVLLVIKTRRQLFESLRKAIEGAHSYQTPEIIAVPVVDGAPAYLEWLDHETHPGA